MDSKFVIFTALSAFLSFAVYSSSTYVVFATLTTTCTSFSKNTSFCNVMDSEDGNSAWECTYHAKTKTWSCVEAKQASGSTNVPPALKDALVKAQAGAKGTGESSSNNTSVTEGNVLKNGGSLKGGETDNNPPLTNSNDTLQ